MQCIKRAVIFSGGNDSVSSNSFTDNADYIICADSGIAHCYSLGLKADLWVGDFDSADYDKYKPLSVTDKTEIIKLNPVKDETDTEFALKCAVERGYNDITLIGAVGSRTDHSLANIFLMEKYCGDGVKIRIVNANNIIHLISDDSIELVKGDMKYVSVLPLDTVRVSNKGFIYPLDDRKLYRSSSLGISNELSGDDGIITISGGTALVIESKD